MIWSYLKGLFKRDTEPEGQRPWHMTRSSFLRDLEDGFCAHAGLLNHSHGVKFRITRTSDGIVVAHKDGCRIISAEDALADDFDVRLRLLDMAGLLHERSPHDR